MPAASPLVLDGVLDEPDWELPAVLSQFTQIEPFENGPPSEVTEVRILYDDDALWVGFTCRDRALGQLRHRMGRRDDVAGSDSVTFVIDPAHDRRSAFWFQVNVAGVQADGSIIEGLGSTSDWDGVWEAAVGRQERAWVAELRIPWSTLRFPDRARQTWYVNARRTIGRNEETSSWVFTSKSDASRVDQMGELTDLRGLEPGLALELRPYVGGLWRASVADDTLGPRDTAELRLGGDAKLPLSGTLTLDVSVNPDFAQVEVDPAIINLSPFDVKFPEKRQVLLEGLEGFATVDNLVYTRRIGAPPPTPEPTSGGFIEEVDASAPIWALAKVSGLLDPRTALTAMSAYVGETHAIERVDGPEGPRRIDVLAAPAALYDLARVRRSLGASSVGVTATQVARPDGVRDATAVGVDVDVRGESEYTATGNANYAFTGACGDERVFECNAWAADLTAGKTGGELQAYGYLGYDGARHELNDLGYWNHLIGTTNVKAVGVLGLERYRPLGPLAYLQGLLHYRITWDPELEDPDGKVPVVDHALSLFLHGRTGGNWAVSLNPIVSFARYDDVETRVNPIVPLYHRDPEGTVDVEVVSDSTRRVVGRVGGWLAVGQGTQAIARAGAAVTVGDRLALEPGVAATWWRDRWRWLGVAPGGVPGFGQLDRDELDVSLRGTVSITPALSVQLFGQLLAASHDYQALATLSDPYTLVPCPADGSCGVATDDFDLAFDAWILNAIARWELRPGTTLHVAYTHGHRAYGGALDRTLADSARTIDDVAGDNVLAAKLTYLWSP